MPGYTVRLNHRVFADNPRDALAATLDAIKTSTVTFDVAETHLLSPNHAGQTPDTGTRQPPAQPQPPATRPRKRMRSPESLVTLPNRSVISTDLYVSPVGGNDSVYTDFEFSLGNAALVGGVTSTVGFWPGTYPNGVVVGDDTDRLTITMSMIDQARLAGWDVTVLDCTGSEVSKFEGYAAYNGVTVSVDGSDHRSHLHALTTLAASRKSMDNDHQPALVVVTGLSQWSERDPREAEGSIAVLNNLLSAGPTAGIHTVFSDTHLTADVRELLGKRASFAVITHANEGLGGVEVLAEECGFDPTKLTSIAANIVSPQPPALFIRLGENEVSGLAPFEVYTPAADKPARLPVKGQEKQWEAARKLLDGGGF